MTKYNLEYFLNKNWSLVIIKKGQIIYQSKKQGLRPLIFCLKQKRQIVKGVAVFDKIIGQAAALLLAAGRVRGIMTPIITKEALKILRKYKIKITYRQIINQVLNKKGTGLCPMEKLSQGKSVSEFYKIMVK